MTKRVLLSWSSGKDSARALHLLQDAGVRFSMTHIAFGDLYLEDIRAYRVAALAGTGEFHRLALDGPMFRKPVEVRRGDVLERDGFLFADLLPGDATATAAGRRAA